MGIGRKSGIAVVDIETFSGHSGSLSKALDERADARASYFKTRLDTGAPYGRGQGSLQARPIDTRTMPTHQDQETVFRAVRV